MLLSLDLFYVQKSTLGGRSLLLQVLLLPRRQYTEMRFAWVQDCRASRGSRDDDDDDTGLTRLQGTKGLRSLTGRSPTICTCCDATYLGDKQLAQPPQPAVFLKWYTHYYGRLLEKTRMKVMQKFASPFWSRSISTTHEISRWSVTNGSRNVRKGRTPKKTSIISSPSSVCFCFSHLKQMPVCTLAQPEQLLLIDLRDNTSDSIDVHTICHCRDINANCFFY